MLTQFNKETIGEEVGICFTDNIKGKNILITGVTWGGLGAESARVVAKYGAGLVILAARRQIAIDETIAKIKKETPSANLRSLVIDLSSLSSVRQAAKEVNEYEENIDVLINNAAIMACPYFKTVDGFEGQFGTNHLGPFLFTNLILSKILNSSTGAPRIVNVSSSGHYVAPVFFDDISFSDGRTYHEWYAYGQSKTANILFTRELNNKFKAKNLSVFSLHPGSISTNLQKHIDRSLVLKSKMLDYYGNNVMTPEFIAITTPKTLQQGVATQLIAAFDPTITEQSGSFLLDSQINNDFVKTYAKDDENARRLWAVSEDMVGEKFM